MFTSALHGLMEYVSSNIGFSITLSVFFGPLSSSLYSLIHFSLLELISEMATHHKTTASSIGEKPSSQLESDFIPLLKKKFEKVQIWIGNLNSKEPFII